MKSEYIDVGFKPSLRKKLNKSVSGSHRYYFEIINKLGFSPLGTPVHSLHNTRAALWCGDKLSDELDALPVLAMSQERGTSEADWFFGVTNIETINAEDQGRTAVESAEFLAPSLEVALKALIKFYTNPPTHIILSS